MTLPRKHIIHKVSVDVNTNSVNKALELKDNIDLFLKHEIFPQLSAMLDDLQVDSSQHLHLKNLEIEVNETGDFDAMTIRSKIIKELKKNLNTSAQQAGILAKKNRVLNQFTFDEEINKNIVKSDNHLTPEKRQIEAFLHFLQTGNLPWFFGENETLDINLIQKYIDEKKAVNQLRSVLINEIAATRLLKQFHSKKKLIFSIIASVKNIEVEKINDLFKAISTNKVKLKSNNIKKLKYNILKILITPQENHSIVNIQTEIVEVYKQLFFNDFHNNKTKKEILELDKELLATAKKTSKIFSEIFKIKLDFEQKNSDEIILVFNDKTITIHTKESSEKQSLNQVERSKFEHQEFEENSSFLVDHAGLILLHPFLKNLFSAVEYLNSDGTIKTEKIDHALHLLFYLATAKTKPYEYELVFEKALCGIPVNRPVNRDIKLSKNEKQEADELLKAALSHWASLKSSSIDALRVEFLMREGKIEFQEDKIKLNIQRRAVDLLLEKLPWSIAICRFKWLKKPIYITW